MVRIRYEWFVTVNCDSDYPCPDLSLQIILSVRMRAFCLGLEDLHDRDQLPLCFREKW